MKGSRPWGDFILITQNEPSTVKLITVNKGKRTSLQSHMNRDEIWFIIKGGFKITIGDETITATVGAEFFIKRQCIHRLEGLEEDNKLVEVSIGMFNENDITRFADDYGRS